MKADLPNRRFTFSLTTLILVATIICVVSGWMLERRHYRRELEQEEVVLVRWLPLEKAVALAESWRYVRERDHLESFDQVIHGELCWVIQEAFHLDKELQSLGITDTLETARRAAKLLGCETPSALRSVLKALLKEGGEEVYPFVLDARSKEYTRFDVYPDRLYSEGI